MDYRDLLADVQRHPDGADYHSLRMAYTRSPEYRPYVQDSEAVEQLQAGLQAGNLPAAREAVEKMLAHNYLDIEAHISADYVALRENDEARSAYHRTIGKGLLDAIRATGDGRQFDTAFIVIDVPEEYVLMRVAGFKMGRQTLTQHEGQWFDVVEVADLRTNEVSKVYFNVDIPRSWLEEQVNSAWKEPHSH